MKREPYLPIIWRAIRPFRRRAALVILLVLADTAMTSLGVGIVLPVFQALLAPEQSLATLGAVIPILGDLTPEERMIWVAGATIAVFVLKGVVSLLSAYASRGFSELLRVHWISLIGQRYLFGTYASLQAERQGVLLNNWFNESGAAARFFVSYLAYLSALVLVIALVTLGLLINWKAMMAFLAFGGLTVFLLRHRTFGTMSRLGQLKLRLHQGINAAMAESLLHARDLKLLTAEPVRIAQIDARARDLKSVLVRIGVLGELPRIAGESFAVVALMVLLTGGIVFMNAKPANFLPLLAFFFVAFYRLLTASMQMISARMKANSDLHSVRVVQALLDENDGCEERDGGLRIAELNTDIRFDGVSFAHHPERLVVENVRLVIPRRQITLLIGPSGAGKSTLLDLLLRLYRPISGRILANGCDIADFNLIQWRRLFGYVSQEAALFNGTIKMNLLLARPDANEAELFEVCRLASAHDFIQSFPDGYDTVVGDRGYSVSGGQRKRIAIARALLARPQVLILDEATTSFEQTLERDILQALKISMPDLTVIQVTHRLQSAIDADFVVVLDAGRVVSSGSWADVQQSSAAQPSRSSVP